MKDKAWLVTMGGLVAGLLAIGTGLVQLGVLPWATASEVDKLISLKNQDNKWYRELEMRVVRIESDVTHIKEAMDRVENKLDGGHN